MRKITLILLVAILAGFNSCKPKEKKTDEAPLIEKKSIELKGDLMTPEVLWSLGRLSEPELSPDKKTILYGVTYYDVAQNKGNRELYTIGTDGQNLKRITTMPSLINTKLALHLTQTTRPKMLKHLVCKTPILKIRFLQAFSKN